MNANRVVKSVDVFKDQLISMLKVLYPEPVEPLSLDKRMKGLNTALRKKFCKIKNCDKKRYDGAA